MIAMCMEIEIDCLVMMDSEVDLTNITNSSHAYA